MAFIVAMIPYYGLFKMGFLIFCYHPNTMGATQVLTMGVSSDRSIAVPRGRPVTSTITTLHL